MPRVDFSAQHKRAIINNDYSFAYFLELDTTTPLNAWTGVGTLEHNGKAYNGQGFLLDIDVSDLSFEIQIARTNISISEIPHNDERLLQIDEQGLIGAQGRIFLGLLDSNQRVIDNLIHIQTFNVDNIELTTSREGITLDIIGSTGIGNLRFPTRILWTPEAQNKYLNDIDINKILGNRIPVTIVDTGFDGVYAVLNANPRWVLGIERIRPEPQPIPDPPIPPDIAVADVVVQGILDYFDRVDM